jgi:protein deglycase
VLRRAGIDVTVASIESALQITASRNVKIVADALLADALKTGRFDGVFLPGGGVGAERMRDCAPLIDALRAQKASGALYGAICASPAVVLEAHGLLGVPATAHPAFTAKLTDQSRAAERVVVHGKQIITSKAPGTAIEFALKIVEELCGIDTAKAVAGPMVVAYP